jgi:hypothetical protein
MKRIPCPGAGFALIASLILSANSHGYDSVDGIKTAAGTDLSDVLVNENSPIEDYPPGCLDYIHLDLTTERLGSTWRYNCFGFTFFPRKYLFYGDVNLIFRENCIEIEKGQVRPGDIIAYYREGRDHPSHIGRVWTTDGNGNAVTVRSHHFSTGEWIHLYNDPQITSAWGGTMRYFRKYVPFKGLADVWMKDHASDNGEQYSADYYWGSPDIKIDVPGYDGRPDPDPVAHVRNRVWVRLRNRGDVTAEGIFVKYYWGDPSLGLDPAGWHPIPSTDDHPNPAGPLTIEGESSLEAPYVEWSPEAAPAHQCLMAIAYATDDPRNVHDPDPIVYPFNVPWDNNIAQRNVTVVPLAPGRDRELSLISGNPFPGGGKIQGNLFVVLTRNGNPAAVKQEGADARPPGVRIGFQGRDYELNEWRRFRRASPGPIPCLNGAPEWKHPVAGLEFADVSFPAGKRHPITIRIQAPQAGLNDTYYLHLVQDIHHQATGGYTVVVRPAK